MGGALRWKEHRNLLPDSDAGYSNPDNDPRGSWRLVPFSAQGFRKNQMYKIVAPTGIPLDPPKGRCWAATEPEFIRLRDNGRIGRAIVEKALAQGLSRPVLTAVAGTLLKRRKDYYQALELASIGLDVTGWLLWFREAPSTAQPRARTYQ